MSDAFIGELFADAMAFESLPLEITSLASVPWTE